MNLNKTFHDIFFAFMIFCFLFNERGYCDETQISRDDKDRKKTVCLNMIVKNESRVIKRCLTSVFPLIDSWVICDTGSTDGTQELIKEFMKEKNIPGELHERPWVNFAHNRQEALDLAKNTADYLLLIDADDILSYSKGYAFPALTHDVYLVKGKDKNIQFHNWVFVKANRGWTWKDPIHEHLTAEGTKEGVILNGIEYHYIHDGARSRDPKKNANDMKLMLEALASDPENKRMTYHLAQNYLALGNDHQALTHYQKRVNLGGNPEEVYYSMLCVAKLQEKLGLSPEIIDASYQKALDFRPTRPEAIHYLAKRARLSMDFQKGYEISRLGLDLPLSNDIFDLEYTAYDNIVFECAICCLEIGKYKECKRLCRRLLSGKHLSKEQKAQAKVLLENLQEKYLAKRALKVINKFFGDSP